MLDAIEEVVIGGTIAVIVDLDEAIRMVFVFHSSAASVVMS